LFDGEIKLEKKNIFVWKLKKSLIRKKMADVKEDVVQVEAKAAAKPEVKPEVKAEAQVEAKAEAKAEVKAEPESRSITYEIRPPCQHAKKPKCGACPLLDGFQVSPIASLVGYWLYILAVAIFFGAFLSLIVRAFKK
jgi:hypothetical protein